MFVVEKIFGMAEAGLGPGAIQTRLYTERVPSPTGKRMWQRQVVRWMVENDIYLPYTCDEAKELVSPEVAARLDPELAYGLWWYGRHEVTVHAVSEPDGNGGKRYARREARKPRPREEQIAVPVPAALPRGLVETARGTLVAKKGTERKYLARDWELRGLLQCSCGGRMGTQTTKPRGGEITYYYACNRRRQLRKMGGCAQRSLAAAEVEGRVWGFLSDLNADPEKVLRVGMNRLVELELSGKGGDPQLEARALAEKIAGCDRLRSAHQDQQTAGFMTLDELGAKLKDLDRTRGTARSALERLRKRRERIEELERDRDTIIESYAGMVPDALDALTGEERRRLYGMLRLEVTPTPEGLEVRGALSTSGPRSTAT